MDPSALDQPAAGLFLEKYAGVFNYFHHFPLSSYDLVVCWIPLHYGIFVSLLPDHQI